MNTDLRGRKGRTQVRLYSGRKEEYDKTKIKKDAKKEKEDKIIVEFRKKERGRKNIAGVTFRKKRRG